MTKTLVDNPAGKPIIDGKREVIIEIIAADVKAGKAMSPTECAIAQGCRRSIKGLVNATINKSVSYLEFNDRIERFRTPESAVRELVSFDRSKKFAPGHYYLRPPSKTEKLGASRNGPKKSSNDGSRGPVTRRPHVTVMVRGA